MDYGIAILNTIGVTSTAQRAPRRYRSSYRKQQARQTRRRILGAAASQFLAHGYAGTTIRGIAAEARPRFYWSKQRLVHKVVRHASQFFVSGRCPISYVGEGRQGSQKVSPGGRHREG